MKFGHTTEPDLQLIGGSCAVRQSEGPIKEVHQETSKPSDIHMFGGGTYDAVYFIDGKTTQR